MNTSSVELQLNAARRSVLVECLKIEMCSPPSPAKRAGYRWNVLCLLSLSLILVLVASGTASGQTPASNPSCATPSDGTSDLICAYIDTTHALWGLAYSVSTGSQPIATQFLGGYVLGNPSCTSGNDETQTGQVICAAKGGDGNLYAARFNPLTNFYSGWEGIPNLTLGSDPSCASPGDGTSQVVCGVKGLDDGLYAVRLDGESYQTPYLSLGGFVFGNPSCAANDQNGQVTCGVIGGGVNGSHALYATRFNPATGFSTGYENLGGIVLAGTNPSCVSANDGTGQIICAVVGGTTGSLGPLYGIRLDAGTGYSSGYQSLGGAVIGSPGCASGKGVAVCGVVGGPYDNQTYNVYSISFNPNTYSSAYQFANLYSKNDFVSCADSGDGNYVFCRAY